jgi:uncharacterized membrane protein YqgA involved in biofilm formation
MTGTWINVAAVLVGSLLGWVFGARLSDRSRQSVTTVLGLFTFLLGVSLFMEGVQDPSENLLIPLISLLVGALTGERLGIERWMQGLGAKLEARFAGGSGEVSEGNRFIHGFVTASLLFCVGPMTIIGSIQDGLTGDYQLLAIKSVMDGFASLALASSFGVGVIFSALIVLIYQGGLTLAAAQVQAFVTPHMLAEISVVGGVLLLALAIGPLLQLKPVRTANLLPALVVAPLLVFLLSVLI